MRLGEGRRRYIIPGPIKAETKISTKGYRIVNGEYEHRIVYRQYFGKIPKWYVIHHIDHDKLNNRPDNLIALRPHFHDKLHALCRAQSRYILRDEIVRMEAEYEALREAIKGRLAAMYKERLALERKIDELRRAINI